MVIRKLYKKNLELEKSLSAAETEIVAIKNSTSSSVEPVKPIIMYVLIVAHVITIMNHTHI